MKILKRLNNFEVFKSAAHPEILQKFISNIFENLNETNLA
jgi:hypothetical protein